MALFDRSLAGPGYVILNTIRVMNIIVFLTIIAACAVMLVKIKLVNSFFFFEAVGHVITASISIFLIISELNILRGYFNKHWPLLGQESGFTTFALAMATIGISLLGDLNSSETSQKALGLAFWRIVAAAGILAITMAFVNLLTSFIFADRKAGVTARHVRAYGAVAPQKVFITRSSSNKSFQLGMNREETLPTYRPSTASTRFMSMRNATRFPLKISSPINHNHQFQDASSSRYSRDENDVSVPNLAHHPAMYSGHI
ncbi:hypothetical protein DTO166G4_669 [Paecilomyces variotii]|nr:hypothetical protein DTO166G4_669 [Paecilomyces variotii]KAJ9238867.1 hypothetical protein DTO166G5_2663 [Paecilomyces variotii]